MEIEDVWDLYFSKLYDLLVKERAQIKHLIGKEAEREISRRWEGVDWEGIAAYTKAAISFIEERLYAYNLGHFDRFLKAVSFGVNLKDLASVDWYDSKEEKEEIDAKIQSGLNLMQAPEDIVDDLLDEYGAFPDKSIIEQYHQKPEKNHLPDYALAIAIEQAIRNA